METISFKISPIVARKLDELSVQSNEKSRHICAKKIVEDFVTRAVDDRNLQGQAEIKEMIHLLREDLATAMVGILVQTGKISFEEAQAWVFKTMLLGE